MLVFCSTAGSIIITPFYGLIGYLVTYQINPNSYWWGAFVPSVLSRYSFILGAVVIVSSFLHYSKLKFVKVLDSHEVLLLLFLLCIWLSIPLGLNLGFGINQHVTKMTKVILILLIASHVITNKRQYEVFIYIYVISGMYLGIETYNAPAHLFAHGRLGQGIGGSDLSNGNMLAAHFIAVLAMLGVLFMKNGWKTKLFCILAAAFMVNGIVLIRSRGSFLGLMACAVSALLFSVNVDRKKILIYLIIGMMGSISLVDQGFFERMELIQTDTETMDLSAKSRVDIWIASIGIIEDYPLGVGVGNSDKIMSQYSEHGDKDTHNTYIRCLTDIGYHGLVMLLFFIYSAFRTLSFINRHAKLLPNKEFYQWHAFALKIGIIGFLITVVFVTATYTEAFYWLLMLPLFLKRCLENEIYETGKMEQQKR